ncbi:hypothetical protein IFM89_039493 [Coptis chinensis]|uniref:Uncharacterized protein n=1 Tax=Coptis chinensis TaxID=261450 RepID=A0A835J2K3_9MAGN|nr:hypothetical protein IFM89_039493 [Coptis chinensis]
MCELSVVERASIASMSPVCGTKMGFVPIDKVAIEWLKSTLKKPDVVEMIKDYLKTNKLYIDYEEVPLVIGTSGIDSCVLVPLQLLDLLRLFPSLFKFFLSSSKAFLCEIRVWSPPPSLKLDHTLQIKATLSQNASLASIVTFNSDSSFPTLSWREEIVFLSTLL